MAKSAKSAKHARHAKQNTKPVKKSTQSDDFVSEDAVSSGSASYMKLEKGDNKFRVISKPIAGWLEWIDKKPIRTPLDDGEPEASDEDNKPRKFIALVVIDRKDGNVKILEITQQSIIKSIRALSNNPDWGKPFSYDINVKKEGEDLKTKYTVTPSPKKPLSKTDIAAAKEKPCNLEALYEGEDPWDVENADSVTEYFFK